MTEAEVIEKITKKRNELEEKMSANAGEDVIKALEKEIDELMASLSENDNPREKQVFLDECAG